VLPAPSPFPSVRTVANAELEPALHEKLAFYTRLAIDALSPANHPLTNPETIKEAFESRGETTMRINRHRRPIQTVARTCGRVWRAQENRRDFLITSCALTAAHSLFSACSAFASDKETEKLRSASLIQIDTALQNATRTQHVPGVVAMAASDGAVIYEGAFGSRHLGQGPAMSRDTIFRIASMIKVVTTIAAMQLVEEGKIALDASAPAVDSALTSPQVLTGFDVAGVPQLRPAKQPITLRHLLTHTAGFAYPLWDADALRYARALDDLLAGERVLLPRSPLMFDPGTRWQYGSNIDWVGRIVEAVSGERLDTYFRNHILDPLGMADTGFVISPSQRARQATVHRRKLDGSLVPEPFEKRTTPTAFSGGGGLYSSAPDYLTLIRMLLQGGQFNGARILRAETVALMGQNQIGPIEAGILKTTNPALSNDVDFFPGIPLRWGLGHMINMESGPNGRSAGSLTWAGLLNTYYWIDPAKRVAAVFMTQVLPFADRPALSLYHQFERGIYGAVNAAR
jgi:methyl acetate hydrolase